MPVISISRDTYSHGREIAEKVAEKLNAECVGREVVLKAAEEFNVSEPAIMHALHDAPAFMERLFTNRDSHLAMFKAAFAKHMQSCNVVYHGLAGHIFLRNVPGALKVRIVADMDERIREEVRREGISAKKARTILEAEDAERRKWTERLYGTDNQDARNYDLILNLSSMTVDEAVDAIFDAAGSETFKTTDETVAALKGMSLAAEIEAKLAKVVHVLETTMRNGKVLARVQAPLIQEGMLDDKVREILGDQADMVCVYVDSADVAASCH